MQPALKGVGLHGMTNLDRPAAKLLDENRLITPHFVLNADPSDTGVVLPRRGYAQVVAVSGCHSFWSGSIALCMGTPGQTLYRIDGPTATPLATFDVPQARVNYVELNGLVYMGTPYWKAVLNIATAALTTWGLPTPPAPRVVLGSGNLPPGVYNLCYTTYDGDRLSGHGQFTQVRWEQDTQGITLVGMPDNVLCWMTHPNADKPFLAELAGNTIVGPTVKPLPTHGVVPPPGFIHFTHAFGRIWGACGKRVYYNFPFQYEWFHPGWYLPFPEDVVLIAPCNEGLFINSAKTTWFVDGRDPGAMKLTKVGEGAIPGTLTMGQVEGGGYEISRKLSQLPSPMWANRVGIVIGTNTGHLVRVTDGRIRMPLRSEGASAYLHRDGIPQVISSLTGSVQNADAEILRIASEGKLFE